MSSVYDEKQSLNTTRELVTKLREYYQLILKDTRGMYDIGKDKRHRCTNLAINWPGDDEIRQIVADVSKIMAQSGIDPRNVKW